jgi:hypothetical protein
MTNPPPLKLPVASLAEQSLARTRARPRAPTKAEQEAEKRRCAADPVYFVNQYCQIYSNDTNGWMPFTLWPFQEQALRVVSLYDDTLQRWVYLRVVALKTRQIGFTWLLADAHKLWKMLFKPITEVLVFSQSDEDAMAVLSEERFKGMYKRLPAWMQMDTKTDSAHEFRIANGSGIRALPESRGGDSRTVTDVVIDEADLITDLGGLIARSEPTLGAKGQMVVIGRAVKKRPNSPFKRLYLQAKKTQESDGPGAWNKAIFVAWFEHPGRTKEWKEQLDREVFEREGTLDFAHEHYPSTDLEALSARSLDKRFPPQWIQSLYAERSPIPAPFDAPPIPGLKIFSPPDPNRRYGIGADPAGGKADGDNAVCQVIDADTLEQVALLAGKFEPDQFGYFVADLSVYYNGAPVLFELNNHGHATRMSLRERGVTLRNGMTRKGPGRDPGWLTTEWSKSLLLDTAAKVMQQLVGESLETQVPVSPIIYDATTAFEIASIDINSLSAPEGDHDDHSMAWCLAQMCVYRGTTSMTQQKHRGLWGRKEQERRQISSGPAPMLPGGDKLAQLQAMTGAPRQLRDPISVPAEPEPTERQRQPRIIVTRDNAPRVDPYWAASQRFRDVPNPTKRPIEENNGDE